jgi:hypothetical protein
MHRRHGAAFDPLGFWPGHLKWDYAYTIGELRPDAVYQQWFDWDVAEASLQLYTPRCPGNRGNFRFRLDSPRIRKKEIACIDRPSSIGEIP